jgi:hypothetical protein
MTITNETKKQLYARIDDGRPFTSRDLQTIVDSSGGDARHIVIERFLQACRKAGGISCDGKGPNRFWRRLDNSPVRHSNSIARLADGAPVPHADSWPSPSRQPPSLARAGISADMKAQVAITVRDLIKDIARDYARQPRTLDTIADGLFGLPPHHLVTAIAYLARTQAPYRHMGFGGEIPAINLKGAMLYARHARYTAHRVAGRAA